MNLAKAVTAIRNANGRKQGVVKLREQKLVRAVCDCLVREGFLWSCESSGGELTVQLKYGIGGESVIRKIRSVSCPSRRSYVRRGDVRPVLAGIGVSVLTTNQGVKSDREARAAGVGGEVLVEVS